MTNQQLLLKREVVPGTPIITAMNQVLGIKATPGWSVEGEDFRASGFKVNTSRNINTETGSVAVETLQDYNAMTYTLTGGFGAPVSALKSGGTLAYEHTFTLNPTAPDTLVSFTGMWGDTTQALQLVYLVFNSLGITVNRGGLSLDSSAFSRAPITGIAMPTTGIVKVASVPISSRSWDVYIDDTWAALGTTKALALYEGQFSFGDKYVQDYVVNSAQPSFTDAIENDGSDYSGSFRVGFDASAVTLIDSFKNNALKFIRFESTGPIIETTTTYKLTLDLCVRILNPGEVGAAPNSPARTIPFDVGLTVDPVSSNAAAAKLVNTVQAI